MTEDDRQPSDYLVEDELLKLTKDDFLRLIPTKPSELDWTLTAREATITFVKKKRGILPAPRTKKVVFDQVGAFVLKASDGVKNVQEIGRLLAEAFNLRQDQAEISLIQFLMGLHRRGYIWLKKPPGLTLKAVAPAAPATPPKLCGRCGATLPEGSEFCPQCGAKVD